MKQHNRAWKRNYGKNANRNRTSREATTTKNVTNKIFPVQDKNFLEKHYPINTGKVPDNSHHRWFVLGFIVAIILFTGALLALFYAGKVSRGKGRPSRSFYGRFKALLRRTRLLRSRHKSSKLKRSTTKIPKEDQAPSAKEQLTSITLTNATSSHSLTTNYSRSPSRDSKSSIQEQIHNGKSNEGREVQLGPSK